MVEHALDTMLLKTTDEKQIVLNKSILTKEISITVYNRKTSKRRTYKNKKMVAKLFAECV